MNDDTNVHYKQIQTEYFSTNLVFWSKYLNKTDYLYVTKLTFD